MKMAQLLFDEGASLVCEPSELYLEAIHAIPRLRKELLFPIELERGPTKACFSALIIRCRNLFHAPDLLELCCNENLPNIWQECFFSCWKCCAKLDSSFEQHFRKCCSFFVELFDFPSSREQELRSDLEKWYWQMEKRSKITSSFDAFRCQILLLHAQEKLTFHSGFGLRRKAFTDREPISFSFRGRYLASQSSEKYEELLCQQAELLPRAHLYSHLMRCDPKVLFRCLPSLIEICVREPKINSWSDWFEEDFNSSTLLWLLWKNKYCRIYSKQFFFFLHWQKNFLPKHEQIEIDKCSEYNLEQYDSACYIFVSERLGIM